MRQPSGARIQQSNKHAETNPHNSATRHIRGSASPAVTDRASKDL